MMKTSAKILAAATACAVCVAMAGGAAYAVAPSMDQAEDQVAAENATAAKVRYDEAIADAYNPSTAVLQLATADGAATQPASGSPAILGATQQAELAPGTLTIFGNVISYEDAFGAAAAPDSAAGLWMGTDSTTDGSFGYFVGHHPGVFNAVMYLSNGDQITVCDRDGNTATYTVFAIYDVPDTTTWTDIEPEVTSHGESIVLQTCVGDGQGYRIVEAA